MIRETIAVLMAAILAAGCALAESAQSARLREKIAAVPIGARIDVMLVDRRTVRGTLQSVDEAGFSIVTLKPAAERQFRFAEVRAVRRPSKIPLAAWIGIVAGGALLVFAIWFHEVDKKT